MPTSDYIRAHRHSSNHREEVLASQICGCFYCLKTFSPSQITEWVDKWQNVGMTALCPQCGIDSVLSSESGYPITIEFLRKMRQHWF